MRTIICRFADKEALDNFCNRNGYNFTYLTTGYNVESMEVVTKRPFPSRGRSATYWESEWFDMPEYVSEKQEPYARIDFSFTFLESIDLEYVFDQKFTEKTKSIWFPKLIAGTHSNHRVLGGSSITKYPIYVVSKGRSANCRTSVTLSQMEVPHFVVIEPSDVKDYSDTLSSHATILELDMRYKDEYDTFDDLGDTKSKGPGAARNFCWDHSIKSGHEWHWVMDDNADEGFMYMNNNRKQKCRTGEIFIAAEHFVDRYENIAIAGLNYGKFCKESDKTPAFVMNTRIYSFLLIRNDIDYRWRGRYNEDTDLSLRVLKDNWCTVQFNAFLAGKCTTQRNKGGNTEEFYAKEGTLPKSQMIVDMHPDVAELVWKFNRHHHSVNYKGFKQKLVLKDGYDRSLGTNNRDMVTIVTEEKKFNDTRSYLELKYAHILLFI